MGRPSHSIAATACFDSNVYGYVQRHGQARAVRRLLDDAGIAVWATETNLFEAFRIDNEAERVARMKVIRRVAAKKATSQRGYTDAHHVLAEIRRCRPRWLHPSPDLRLVKVYRDAFVKHWQAIRLDPAYRPKGYFSYSKTVHRTIGAGVNQQKQMRGWQLGTDRIREHNHLTLPSNYDDLQGIVDAMSFDEAWFRISSAFTWLQALSGEPQLQDLSDYLKPYLRTVPEREWLVFWLTALEPEAVPYELLASRIAWAQPSRPITAGNAADIEHATHLLDYDYFVTADRDFHAVLVQVQREHYPAQKAPVFVRAQNPNVVNEVGEFLKRVH